MNEKIKKLKDENEKLNKDIEFLKEELYKINNSDGMKILKKYYKIRDLLLPVNTKRRTIAKVLFKFLKKFNCNINLLNRKNFSLIAQHLKRGDIKVLLLKIEDKLDCDLDSRSERKESHFYYNDLLRDKPAIKLNNNIIVDIIVPIYNAYEYTVKCICSVLANTDVPYNLILLNDNSTDDRVSHFINDLKKIKSDNLREISIVEHQVNLGFVKNVNYGLGLTHNNVVILNTDTEVPKNWLSRLIYPYLLDNKVASITPFSNAATILSFPKFCEDNMLPNSLNVNEVDSVFAKYGSDDFYEIPTGVGFCMFMSRKAIDEIGMFDYKTFEKGYGEENDWCRRSKKKGFRNVAVNNLFVYHKHGASFGEIIDKSKEERIRENLIKLNKKHPEYDMEVQRFIKEDPNKYRRNLLQIAVTLKSIEEKEIILYINHSLGGGATVYLDNLLQLTKQDSIAIVMEMNSDKKSLALKSEYFDEICFDLEKMSMVDFNRLLELLNVRKIFVNELVSYPLPKMIDFILCCGLPYIYFVHDFFSVCPSLNLIGKEGDYCYASKDISKCDACIKENSYKYSANIDTNLINSIVTYRKNFYELLSKAEKVIAPSKDTAKILRKIYPQISVFVKEHRINVPVKNTFSKEFCKLEKVRIGIVGAISRIKGSNILYEVIDKVRSNCDNIEFVIIGYTDKENEGYVSEDGVVTMTGKYDNKKISNILEKYKVSLVMLPNIWPETFSYTSSETILSGYPLLTFDLGAAPERIRRYDCGWCVKEISCEAMYKKCVYLSKNRDEILEKASNCSNAINELLEED